MYTDVKCFRTEHAVTMFEVQG